VASGTCIREVVTHPSCCKLTKPTTPIFVPHYKQPSAQ
jgi:hypothetical protein